MIIGEGGLPEDKTVELTIDLSTTGPIKLAQIDAEPAAKNMSLVDATISGGVSAGALTPTMAGNLTAWGKADIFLQYLGNNLFVIGDTPVLAGR